MSLLTVSSLSKQIPGGFAVQNLSFTLEAGQKLAIIGETGSGKTTLLKMIGGLLQPASGTILFEGQRVLGPDEQLLPGHPGIAYLGQHFELRNNYRVWEELERFNLLDEEEAQQLYALCQIEHLLKRRTSELSGGERQRIALAKQLGAKPRLLLLDEPFSNLDLAHKNTIKKVIDNITSAQGLTCIMIAHDPADILPWANEVMVMQTGGIIQTGSPQVVYYRPVSAYAAELLGPYYLLPAAETALLTGISVSGSSPKRLFVRPEQLYLAGKKQHTLDAVVDAVRFGGPVCLAQLHTGTLQLTIPVQPGDVQAGEHVLLGLHAGERWYL
jgi:ABC-type sulfate/molybdate transport systems ATPase subunit